MSLFSRGGAQAATEKPRESAAQRPAARQATEAPPALEMPPDPLVWRQEVALAAYYRWLERGAPDGSDQQDWYDAEADLSKQTRSS